MNAHTPKSPVDYALEQAAEGYPMFPLIPNGKTPAIKKYPELATTDAEQIKAWARQFPNCNWGMTCRYKGGFLTVADVDNKNGKKGTETVLALELEGKVFPQTREHATAKGDPHYIYNTEKAYTSGANKLGEGIDIKSGASSFLVAPGSLSDTAYKVAAKLRALGCDADVVLELMFEHWDYDPAPDEDIDEIVANAFRYAKEPQGSDAPEAVFNDVVSKQAAGEEAARKAGEAAGAGSGSGGGDSGGGDAGGGSGASGGDSDGAKKVYRFRPMPLRDPKSIPPRAFVYGKHYIRKFLSSTVAPGGLGKSSLVLVEAIAMATRKALLGVLPDERDLRVAYWNGEDPFEEIERRVAAIRAHYQIKDEELEGRLFAESGRELPITIAQSEGGAVKVVQPCVDLVKAAVREAKIDVLIIDPFVSAHSVPENDNMAIETVVRQWMQIADECNISVELVHHVRKGNGGEITADDARGAAALKDKARDLRVLNVMSEDQATAAGVDNRRLHFTFGEGKQNLRSPDATAEWFKLESVDLLNMTDRPSDHVGVVTRWYWPAAFAGVEQEKAQACLDALREASGEHAYSPRGTGSAGLIVGRVLGLDMKKKEMRKRVQGLIDNWVERGFLEKYRGRSASRNECDMVRVVRDAEA